MRRTVTACLLLAATLPAACADSPAGTTPEDAAPADAGDGAPDAAGPAGDAGRDAATGPDGGADAGSAFRWVDLTRPEGGPLGRWGFATADLGDGTAILFGGTTIDVAGNGERLDDTWFVDARGIEPVFTRLEPLERPAPRYCGCATYDSTRGLVILVGGRDEAPLDPQTWVFDVEAMQWSDLALADTPPGSVGCAMAYSPDDDATILFGGGGLGAFDDGTYRFDADVPAWTRLETTGPSQRYDAVLRWVGPGEPLLLFGGSLGAIGDGFYADVWRFEIATATWTETDVAGEVPPGRRGGWLAVEPDGAGFLVGLGATGIQPGEDLSDLWRFDFATRRWSELAPAEPPPARGFSLWLPGGPGRVGLLLGGFDNSAPLPDLLALLPPPDDDRW